MDKGKRNKLRNKILKLIKAKKNTEAGLLIQKYKSKYGEIISWEKQTTLNIKWQSAWLVKNLSQLQLATLVVHIVDTWKAETQQFLRWRIWKELEIMTKKDYELMAAVMKSHSVLHQKATKAIMNSLIEHLKKDNPKFDASRFKEASGYIDN